MSRSAQPSPVPLTPPGEPAPRPIPVPTPVQPRPPRRWWVPALLMGAGLLAAGLYWLLKPTQTPQYGTAQLVHTAPVAVGPIERVIRIAGQTSARNYATIMVPVFRGPDSGHDLTLMKVAKAGSLVKKGDVVAQLDPQNLVDHLDDARDTVEQAHNDVEKKKVEQEVEWETLQQQLRLSKADRDKAALDQKAAEVKTDIEREIYKLNAEESEAAYKELLTDQARKKRADASEMRIVQITARRQELHLEHHEADVKRFTINAPMDGLVVMVQSYRMGEFRQIQQGDLVYPGMQFMKIVDTASMQLDGMVSQADSGELRVGQTATMGLDAFPELRLTGTIRSIGALAVKGMWDTYYLRNVPVRVTFQSRDQRVIPDLSGWAEIHVDRVERATVIPLAAVRMQGQQPVVWVKRGAGFEQRPIELGLRNTTHVAVLSGLQQGEEVALEAVK